MIRHGTIRGSIILALLTTVAGVGLDGCSTGTTTKEESTPVLELSIRMASLDLSDLNRRLTRADVEDLWALMKKEKVEVLAVQNITRYPGLTTRTDLVDEFASVSGWRSAFGELVDNSGRVTGNAILASYPIRSRATIPFHTVKGAVFEGALQVVLDGGVREIIIVSATYPEESGARAKEECRTLIARARGNPSAPMILSGSNPEPREGWEEAFAPNAPVGIQYDGLGLMKLLDSRRSTSRLGDVAIATFGMYRVR